MQYLAIKREVPLQKLWRSTADISSTISQAKPRALTLHY